MKRINILKLFIGLLILIFGFIYFRFIQKSEDEIPPWHPFELNSEITIKSLVQQGYRCEGIPCGQPQFVLTKGDTSIQYDVSSIRVPYSYALSRKLLAQVLPFMRGLNMDTTNQYYPYSALDLEVYTTGIYWRVYQIEMDTIDSLSIVDFIERHGGRIVNPKSWNAGEGGNILVYHRLSRLYFDCSLFRNLEYEYERGKKWHFSFVRETPYLDQGKLEELD